MNMFIGDSDQWEEMLAEEARLLAEEALNSTSEASSDGIMSAVADAFRNDEF